MDLQYISETSLVYVSGYVAKAEKSNVQDIWNDISNSDSVYKCLFQFGIKSMRLREVGLYEASELLLGDHLHKKSATVQYIGADMPHKRKRMLKNYSELKAMAAKNPNAEDIYMLLASLITFIQRGLVNWKMFAFMILLPIINM